MNSKEKELFFEEFNNGLHKIGRITMILALILLFSVPFVVGALNGVSPDWKAFMAGFANVGIIYLPMSIVEFLIYTPMLGVGGSYLSFLTGNVTNMLVDEYTFIATTNDNPNRFVIKLYDVDSVNEISDRENYIYIDNGDLVVGNIKGAALIDIYDILGRDIMKLETTEKEVRMNVSEFNMGIYIVRITDDNGVKTRKVIVE